MAFLLLWFPLAVDVKGATPAVQQLATNLFGPNTAFGKVLHRLKNKTQKRNTLIYFALLEMSTITVFPNNITA